MVSVIRGAGAVLKQETLVNTVICLTHGCVHAHVRGYACQHNVPNALSHKNKVQISRIERSLAGLVNHCLAGQWSEFGDNIPSWFPPRENPSARPGIPNRRTDLF